MAGFRVAKAKSGKAKSDEGKAKGDKGKSGGGGSSSGGHGKLSGGARRMVNGSPVYIKGGKIVAGNTKVVAAVGGGKGGDKGGSGHSTTDHSSAAKVAGRSHTVSSYAAHHGVSHEHAEKHLGKLADSGHAASHSGDKHFIAHGSARPEGSKVGGKKPSTKVADRVVKTAKAESSKRTESAGETLKTAKSGKHDISTAHRHIDRAARNSTKGELFEAAKSAGHNVDGIKTKKDLTAYLKAHAENHASGKSDSSKSSTKSDTSPSDRQILTTIHHAIRNPSVIKGGSGHNSPELVAIHKIRDHVEATHGKVDGERFNKLMLKQSHESRKGHDVLEISDNRMMTPHQLDRSIPSSNATFAYAVRKDRDVKRDPR